MRTILSCVLVFMILAPLRAPAAPLTEWVLRRSCLAHEEEAKARCAAYLHGTLEREALPPLLMRDSNWNHACAAGAIGDGDMARWIKARFQSSFFAPQGRVKVPCVEAPGFWTNIRLRDECVRELLGPCRYFIDAVVRRAMSDGLLVNRRHYCMAGFAGPLQRQELLPLVDAATVPLALTRWMRAHPGRGKEPAATGVVDALEEAYPCAEGKWAYLKPGELISGPLIPTPVHAP